MSNHGHRFIRRVSRMVILLFESGVPVALLTLLLFSVRPNTVLWDMTKGGDRVAWVIALAIILAFWLAFKERRLFVRQFSLVFHSLYVALVLVMLVVYWMEPFPD